MVSVPQYRPQVQSQSARLPMADPGMASARSFGADIGAGLQNLGQGITNIASDAASVVNRINVENMQRVSKDNENEYSRYQSELMYGTPDKPGYLSLNGQAALDAYPALQQALDQKRQDLMGSIGNQKVKDAVGSAIATRFDSAMGQAGNHAYQQREVANDMASKTRIQQANSDAALGGRDPEILMRSLDIAEMETRDIAQRKGFDDATMEAMIMESRSKVYDSAITAASAFDNKAARKMFDEHQGDMDGITRVVLHDKLDARDRQIVNDRENAERQADKDRVDFQRTNYSAATVQVAQGTMTQPVLVDMLNKSRISTEQYHGLLSYLTSPDRENGDPTLFNNMKVQAYRGDMTFETVMTNPTLSKKQQSQLIDLVASVDKSGGPLARQDVKQAFKDLDSLLGGIRGLDQRLTGPDAEKVVNGLTQLRTAILNTPATALTSELIEKYKQEAYKTWNGNTYGITIDPFRGAANPRYWIGARTADSVTMKNNLTANMKRTMDAFERGELDQTQMKTEMDNFEKIRANLEKMSPTTTKTGK